MQIYQTSRFSISFGTLHTSFECEEFFSISDESTFRVQPPFRPVVETFKLSRLMALRQVHGIAGKVLNSFEDFSSRPYAEEGDYLITSVSQAGLGVATADCLPVILYDSVHHVIALIHAGWKGSIAGICQQTIQRMQHDFGTKAESLEVIFGPAAGVCCYEVSEPFSQHVPFLDRQYVFVARNGKLFFDLPAFMQLQLERCGVNVQNVQKKHNVCTICSLDFCSYRRDGSRARRQMTIAALKSI